MSISVSPLCRPSAIRTATPVRHPESHGPRTNVFEIIRRARDEGIALKLNGDRLKANDIPPPALMGELLAHEALIVELLKAAEEYPRRRAWAVSVSGYRFFLIGPCMSRTQALALARWRWKEAEILD
ncbi:hypothetical protein [Azotobacter chroococcum]|jgi:hypothetical protein|uniref:hypothetical protein n=1 Tax=Azotobacter chroococcum TaxID=353 RepID=UPI001F0DB534|nr:hypothetical protein [Azotobacter chroococcum]